MGAYSVKSMALRKYDFFKMISLTLTGQQVPQPSAIEVTLQLWLQQTFGGSQLLWWKARQTGDCSTKVPI